MITQTAAETIRPATMADIPQIVEMGLRFADSVYMKSLTANREGFAALAASFIDNPETKLLVSAEGDRLTGMFAITTYVQPMSLERVATEVVWWMDPEARGSRTALRMLHQAEDWARAKGAVRLQMIAPTAHVGQFYERLGFEQIEIHYQRVL